MKRLNKKGFTLIELMAVVIVLIIVLLIAMSRIRQTTNNAKRNTVKANALSYIKAVKEKINLDSVETESLDSGVFSVDDLKNLGISLSGKTPDSGFILVSDYKVVDYCLIYDDFKVEKLNDSDNTVSEGSCDNFYEKIYANSNASYEYSFVGANYQTFTAPEDGNYLVQLWGAQGNYLTGTDFSGGKGAYTQGIISLEEGTTLYIYVGENRNDRSASFNAGSTGGGGNGTNGANGYGGGGATDIRLVSGTWNDTTSLRSRIMVAGGGGGCSNYDKRANGGYAGGLIGASGINAKYDGYAEHIVPTGGTQTSGGLTTDGNVNKGSNGSFGIGGNGNNDWGSAGGGGYYGGGGGGYTDYSVDSGAGGSSYISGHTGCVAITSKDDSTPKAGCDNGTTNNDCSVHYSDYVFTSTIMKSGNENMPSYDGSKTMKGNSGSGHAKITFLGEMGEKSSDKEFAFKFADYDKLSYISSSGTQYINTGITPTNNTGFKIKASSSNVSSDLVWFGVGNGNGYRLLLGSYNNVLYLGYNNLNYTTYSKSGITANQQYEVLANYNNNNSFIVDGETINSSLADLTTMPSSLSVFAYHNNTSYSHYSSLNLYDLKITEGTNFVRNFIPCRNKTYSSVGLCDLVSGTFFENGGTGEISAGE